MTNFAVQILLFCGLIGVAVAIARSRNLLNVTIFAGLFSFLLASLFVALDAVDVALTEAAVGAGISTVLLLGAIALITKKEKSDAKHVDYPALLLCLVLGAALLYGMLDMPPFGDASSPALAYLAPDFVARTPVEIGIPNLVTGVLASYRGYDTLGEVAVIFTAFVGVMYLLGGFLRRAKGRENKR